MSGKRAKRLRGHGKKGTMTPSIYNLMEIAAIYVAQVKRVAKRRFRRQSFQQIINPFGCANRYVKVMYMQHRAKTGVSL